MIKMMILTVGIFGLIMLVMAVGVIFQGKTLHGSCGGVGSSCACEDAGEPVCESKRARDAAAGVADRADS